MAATSGARVVIIGGGFAGLFAARAAAGPAQVTLIDRAEHHLFQPLLYQCATDILGSPICRAAARPRRVRHRVRVLRPGRPAGRRRMLRLAGSGGRAAGRVRVYVTYNIKGGVEKTSTAVDLAAASGRRALLWDLDPQGAATYLVPGQAMGEGRPWSGLGHAWVDDAVKATDFDNLDLLVELVEEDLETRRGPSPDVHRLANDVDIYSEEIALTWEQIGNVPQAFTHLALIDAASTLDKALNRRGHRRRRSRPWPGRSPPSRRCQFRPGRARRPPDWPEQT